MVRVEGLTTREVNAFLMDRYASQEALDRLWSDLTSLREELAVRAAVLEQERVAKIGGVTVRKMKWGRDGQFMFWDGKRWFPYEQILDRSVAQFPEGEVRKRFEAEKVGWLRAGRMGADLQADKAIVIGSPPADIYRDKNGQGLSAFFVLVKAVEGEWLAYSLYVPEISLEEHRKLLGLEAVQDADEMVAEPVVMSLGDVEELVKALGFEGWGEVTRRAVDLDNPHETKISECVLTTIENLWTEFRYVSKQTFWLAFSDMIYDFLIKDIKGLLVKMSEADLKREGLVFLLNRLVTEEDWQMAHILRWQLAAMGIKDDFIGEWQERQEAWMKEKWYQVIWGGAHGSGEFSLGGNWVDLRWGMVRERQNREKQVTCPKCYHSWMAHAGSKVRCPHCGEVIEVS